MYIVLRLQFCYIMFLFPSIQSPDYRDGVYMLPISKSKGRAVLRRKRRVCVCVKEVTSSPHAILK